MTKHEMFLQGSLDRLLDLTELDGKLDYSIESVRLIDDIIDKYFLNGEPVASGFFAEMTEYRITALATYVGEVIIRNTIGTKWIYIPNDKYNGSLLETELQAKNGLKMWPGIKTVKRIRNGKEDELHSYVLVAIREYINKEATSDSQNDSDKKPWWKLW